MGASKGCDCYYHTVFLYNVALEDKEEENKREINMRSKMIFLKLLWSPDWSDNS